MLIHIPVPSETFIINEIIALQTVGVNVYPVALRPPQACHEELMADLHIPVYYLSEFVCQHNVEGHSLYSAASDLARQLKIPLALAAPAALAAEYMYKCSIEHIHAHFASEAALVALIVSKLTGIPFSFTAHAYDIFRLNVAGEASPERRLKVLVDHAAKLITVSEYNKKHFVKLIGQACAEKLEIVHYGMDFSRFNSFERKNTGPITLLSVGRLVEKKGHQYLLRAFKQVLAESPNVRLRIVGDGYLRDTLDELLSYLGIAGGVTFLGAVSTDVVLYEMKKADIFVLPSITGADGDREGMPVSIMEACMTGLPVISTRHAGIPELVVEGESGLLVDEKDVEGLAQAIKTLVKSPDLRIRMGMAGHKIVAENYNILQEAAKLQIIFEKIISGSSGDIVERVGCKIEPDSSLQEKQRGLNSFFRKVNSLIKKFLQ